MWNIFVCVIFITCREINAGADMDVLQVKSPYVDSQDNGPLMSMNSNSRLPVRYYPQQGSLQHGCIACQYGSGGSTGSSYSSGYRYPETVGTSGKSFSSGYQTSGTSGYKIPGSYQAYSSPVQSSSTAHEFKKEQKFVNGQQTYDFHLEKEYKDGNLIKNEIREKTPQDFGVHNYPHRAEPYGSSSSYIPSHGSPSAYLPSHGSPSAYIPSYGSPSYSAPKAASSSYSSSSSHSSYNILPQPSSDVTFEGTAPREVIPGQYQGYGSNVGVRQEGVNFGVQHGDADFDAEVERLRKEMEMRTLSLHHGSLGSVPAHQGGSHRTEVRTEMKYVNGKPVYIKNEERKYKDGKLIHNETEEKGPKDLGTTGIIDSRPIHAAPARVYSSQYEQNVRQEEQYPASRYPGQVYDSSSQYTTDSRNEDTSRIRYQPSSYSSEGQPKHTGNSYVPKDVNYRPSTHGSSYYVPERVYTTETREESDQIRTSVAHQPNSYATDSEYRYKYQPTSYSSPQTGGQGAVPYRPTTTTISPETTIAPRKYDYSSQTQENVETSRQYNPYRPNNYDSQTNPSDRYKPRSESYGTSRYSNERTAERRSELHSPQTVPTTTTTTTTTTTPRPTVRSYRRPVASQLSQSEDRITETSQSSHYNENPSNYYPQRSREQNTPAGTKDLSQERKYSQSFSERHSQTSEVAPQAPKTYQPNSYSSSVTRKEDATHEVSSAYSPSQYDRRVGQGTYYRKYGTEYDGEENEDENEEEEEEEPVRNYLGASGKPTLNSGAPAVTYNKPVSNKYPVRHEPQRYDISPLVDGAESEVDTHEIPKEIEDRPRPVYNNNYKPIYSPHETTHSHRYYEESRANTSGQPIYRPHLQPAHLDHQSSVALTNSSSQRTDHRVTTVIPSRWVETRTKWRYFNGRLISETQYHKYYENGILIHDNSTEKSRDQLAAEGVDVQKLDLTASQLAQYGPTMKSTTHSQSHEVSQIQRFRNGQQTYELNHDKRFQDGQLVHENKEEKNENDFLIPDHLKSVNHQQFLSQHLDQHTLASGYGSRGYETDTRQSPDYNSERQQYHSQKVDQQSLIGGYDSAADLHQTADFSSSNPSAFVRKHEVRQEEEFVNGQKVYNLFHEKEYQDGNLIRENKTELGPEDLGAQSVIHRDALQDLLGGKTTSTRGREALHQQQKSTENILTTQCLTCSNQLLNSGSSSSSSYMSGGHSSSVLGSLGIPVEHVNSAAGTTYKHDVNVEEHYENGQMVKGREDSKKWRDGRLIDAKTEHYYDGSSRTGLDLSGSPVFGGGSSLALSGTQEGRTILGTTTHENSDEDCSYNHCLNGASCRKSGKNNVCICQFGFKGTICEEAYCPKSYCRYGGSCSISAGQQACVCPSGYTGHRCSTRLHTIRVGG